MIRATLIGLILILLCLNIKAQSGSESDFELWLRAGGKLDLAEQWKLNFEEQLRFDDNVTAVKSYHTEIELIRSLGDQFEVFFVPRFIRRNNNSGDNQGYENLIRFQVGGEFEHRQGQFEIKHRLLYQTRNELGVKKNEGDVPEEFLRFKLSTEYKIQNWKYDPEFSIEYFGGLNNELAETNNQMRISFGTERDYDKLGEFGIKYLYEWSLGLPIQKRAFILMFSYQYEF